MTAGLGMKNDSLSRVEAEGKNTCLFRQHPDVLRVFWTYTAARRYDRKNEPGALLIRSPCELSGLWKHEASSFCSFKSSAAYLFCRTQIQLAWIPWIWAVRWSWYATLFVCSTSQTYTVYDLIECMTHSIRDHCLGLVLHEYAGLRAGAFLPRVSNRAFNGRRMKASIVKATSGPAEKRTAA